MRGGEEEGRGAGRGGERAVPDGSGWVDARGRAGSGGQRRGHGGRSAGESGRRSRGGLEGAGDDVQATADGGTGTGDDVWGSGEDVKGTGHAMFGSPHVGRGGREHRDGGLHGREGTPQGGRGTLGGGKGAGPCDRPAEGASRGAAPAPERRRSRDSSRKVPKGRERAGERRGVGLVDLAHPNGQAPGERPACINEEGGAR